MKEMTTPTDTDLTQALRELFETWLESRPSFRTTVEVQAAWEGWKANTAVAAMLAAHESRAQPASVDEIAMHLACEHGDTDDAATGYSFTMEQFDAFVHAFVRAIRNDLPAQPASVAGGFDAMVKAVQPIAKAITPTVPRPFKGNIWELEGDITIGECKAFIEAVYALAAAPHPQANERVHVGTICHVGADKYALRAALAKLAAAPQPAKENGE